jgi:hypothetical protein
MVTLKNYLGVGMRKRESDRLYKYRRTATVCFSTKVKSSGEPIYVHVLVKYVKGIPFENIYENYSGVISRIESDNPNFYMADLTEEDKAQIIKEGILGYNL